MPLRFDPRVLMVMALLAVSGCGADETADAPVRERTTPTPAAGTPEPSEAEPSPTAEATATPDATPEPSGEDVEGGGGDEEAAEQTARFLIGEGGEVTPTEVSVTAFLPVRITFNNESSQELQLDLSQLGQANTILGPGESRDVTLAGPQPGTYGILVGERLVELTAVRGGSP